MSRQILSAFQYTNSGQSTGSPQRFGNQSVGQPSNFPRGPIAPEGVQVSQDGRPTRRIVIRKTVDYNGPLFRYEESRPLRNALGGLSGSCSSSTLANSSSRGLMCALQPDPLFAADLPLPRSLPEAPINALCLKHVRTATNKIRSPINALVVRNICLSHLLSLITILKTYYPLDLVDSGWKESNYWSQQW